MAIRVVYYIMVHMHAYVCNSNFIALNVKVNLLNWCADIDILQYNKGVTQCYIRLQDNVIFLLNLRTYAFYKSLYIDFSSIITALI